jgi:hypothetical protein
LRALRGNTPDTEFVDAAPEELLPARSTATKRQIERSAATVAEKARDVSGMRLLSRDEFP